MLSNICIKTLRKKIIAILVVLNLISLIVIHLRDCGIILRFVLEVV